MRGEPTASLAPYHRVSAARFFCLSVLWDGWHDAFGPPLRHFLFFLFTSSLSVSLNSKYLYFKVDHVFLGDALHSLADDFLFLRVNRRSFIDVSVVCRLSSSLCKRSPSFAFPSPPPAKISHPSDGPPPRVLGRGEEGDGRFAHVGRRAAGARASDAHGTRPEELPRRTGGLGSPGRPRALLGAKVSINLSHGDKVGEKEKISCFIQRV